MDHLPLAPEVEQAKQEDRRERQPDVGRVELVAELPRIAAGHLPGDLVAGPRLPNLAGGIVDDHLDALCAAGEEVDLPGAGLGLGRGAQRPVPAPLVGHLAVGAGDADRVRLRDVGRRAAGGGAGAVRGRRGAGRGGGARRGGRLGEGVARQHHAERQSGKRASPRSRNESPGDS